MTSAGVLVSSLLDSLEWVEYGFGTRQAVLSQDGMASLEQIHSAVPLVVREPGSAGEGDALITNRPGLAVSVRTADCFPMLFADTRRRAVAAVHAGWRGTAGQIGPLTLQKMHDAFGTASADVRVAIGPGIGACCYRVGIEVATRFGLNRAGPLNLAEINWHQLMDAGVPEANIEVLSACTFCDPQRFYSYRRDGLQAGRMISYIRL